MNKFSPKYKKNLYLNITPHETETIQRKLILLSIGINTSTKRDWKFGALLHTLLFDSFDSHTKFHLSQITLRGMLLKVVVVEALFPFESHFPKRAIFLTC